MLADILFRFGAIKISNVLMPIGALRNHGALGNVRRLASRTTFTIGLVLKNSGGIIQR